MYTDTRETHLDLNIQSLLKLRCIVGILVKSTLKVRRYVEEAGERGKYEQIFFLPLRITL